MTDLLAVRLWTNLLDFLQANWGTIIALLAVMLLVFLAVRKMVKDRKAGIGPCGQKCSHCPNAHKCHQQTD